MGMKKVMKKPAMKKAMKKVMKKAMKKSMKSKVIATGRMAKSLVFRGSRTKTVGGLKKTDLKKNKTGKVVSAKMSEVAKKNYGNRLRAWVQAVTKARAALKVKGFVAIKKGSPLYNKAKEIYAASKK